MIRVGASWLRRRILRLYPSEFRARFGDEIEQVLVTAEHDLTSRPFRDTADLLVTAASQQWRYTMSTTSDVVNAPLATAGFVVALIATVGGLALSVAWAGFAPVAIAPAAAAYVLGRRSGALAPSSASRRIAGGALLIVLILAAGVGTFMWVGSRG